MSPTLLLTFILIYFAVLVLISYLTSGSADNSTFFIANRNSKWYLVAFGMIGTTLSGVTFISVPGAVGRSDFSYFQFIMGNAAGLLIIIKVLLPLYYRVHLVSIYTYLEKRFGFWSYKTGAMIFLVSRTIGSAFRLYLVGIVLQKFIFDSWNVPFWVTIVICLGLIWSYTFRGGLKTIIISDTLQTTFLLTSVVLSIVFLSRSMGLSMPEAFEAVKESSYSRIFFWEDFLGSKYHFIKQFLGGLFVTLSMTGLDQDLMQKNLSCKNLGEAQKNMFTFTGIFVVINVFFLSLGALLYKFAAENGIDVASLETPDHLYPEIAFNYLSLVPAVIFMLGLTAATFATTDSALTALTTSFCVDFLGFDKKEKKNERRLIVTRHAVHLIFSFIVLLVILVFRVINDDSVVNSIFVAAGYTYGPLIGLFAYGISTSRGVNDRLVPIICILSPVITFFLNKYSVTFMGYSMGFELIVINGLISFILLYITGRRIKP